MSINLGTPACEALKNLRVNGDFVVYRNALREQVRQRMNQALDAPPDKAMHHLGYTQALRDLYVAIEAEVTGKQQQQVQKPAPVKE